jgi:hypothetical protein
MTTTCADPSGRAEDLFAVTAEMRNACSSRAAEAILSRKIVARETSILFDACRSLAAEERNMPFSGARTLAGSEVFWHGPQPE